MRPDQDFLLYPLATAEMPACPSCARPLAIMLHEARKNRPDISTYICEACARSERFVCNE
jgi:hypothetical protein